MIDALKGLEGLKPSLLATKTLAVFKNAMIAKQSPRITLSSLLIFISFFTFNAQASTTKDVTVSWNPVSSAFGYQLEEKGPGSTSFVPVYQGVDTRVVLPRELGEYRYRVIGCVRDPVDRTLPACSPDYAHYSEEAYLNLQNAAATRRVIFLHTDLLGSVAAETNEQGASN